METMQEEEIQTEQPQFREDTFRKYAKRIVDGEIGDFTYCLENNEIYLYDEGVWKHITEIEFLDRIEKGLRDKNGNLAVTKFPVEKRKKIIDNFKILAYKKLEQFNNAHYLNFENCMFDPNNLSTVDHSREYYSTIRIPYRYDSNAECPLWLSTLNEILEFDKHKVKSLQEFFGQCLTRDVKQEKAMLLLGESRSGKSTILNTLQNMVGAKNCSSIALKNFTNPQYTSMMVNKLINFDKDVSKKAADFEDDFKKIVTGEEANCNDKYIAPFDFRPYCKVVLSANIFPNITDHSSAFYNRLILIPCDRVFKPHEQNRNLRQELLEELPGVLNWAIEGLKRLLERGHFEEVHFMKEALVELEEENNPVNSFFKEHIAVDLSEGAYIEKAELFNKYKDWCKKNEQYNLSNLKFASCVFRKFSQTTPKGSRISNNGPRIWKHLRYMEFKADAPEPREEYIEEELF